MNIHDKLERAEELWSKGKDLEAEDIQGSAYFDIEHHFNNIQIKENVVFSDIIMDMTLDMFTLIIQIKENEMVSINFKTLSKLNDISNKDIELSYMNKHLFIYMFF